MKGKLITVYGINNIGKSTHCKLLVERLRSEGHKAHYVKYPVYDVQPSGDFINGVLRSSGEQHISEDELQLWFILNRYQFQPTLEGWLNEGAIVIAEDYVGTGMAWGMAKGLEEDWLISANKNLRKEDFALMIEGERCLHAIEETHVHEQNEELIEKSRAIHDQLAEEFGWERVLLQDKKKDTAKIIWEKVEKFLKES